MSQRYFIYLSYNGLRYCGWQNQPNALSVQQLLEEALTTLLRVTTPIVGAGRTDAGVHAKLMVAHFDAEEPIDAERLTSRLNSYLPVDIAIDRIVPVMPDAHARFSALSRRYEYHVIMHKDPFIDNLACRVPMPLDFDAMNEAAAHLMRYSDFTSFSKLHTDAKTNLCVVTQAHWRYEDGRWVFTIEANRFLRNMVRAVVGTLFEVGKGRLTPTDFCAVVEARDRGKAGHSVPAKGLYLVDVTYPESLFQHA